MDDWEDEWDDKLADEGDQAQVPWDDEEEGPVTWDDEDEADLADADPFGAVSVQKDVGAKKPAAGGKKGGKKIKAKPIKKKQLQKKLEQTAKVDSYEEKLRQLELQKESDFENATDLLSGPSAVSSKVVSSFTPKTEVEFYKFSSMVVDDLSKFDDSEYYTDFIIDLVKKLAGQMDSDEVSKITKALNLIYNEKMQQEKGKKKKTVKSKVVSDFAEDDFIGDEYDAFF
mmetsp:Transcript_32144/g.54946  ORF Transcript_32144/g.54946 Transcript_32144/m.54946 type:complete len:228 (-) Transcript_32144:104-787(-)